MGKISTVGKFIWRSLKKLGKPVKELAYASFYGFIGKYVFIAVLLLGKWLNGFFGKIDQSTLSLYDFIESFGSTLIFFIFVLYGVIRILIVSYYDICRLCFMEQFETKQIKNRLLNMGSLEGKLGDLFRTISEAIQNYNPEENEDENPDR
jgi:hypothetical protein